MSEQEKSNGCLTIAGIIFLAAGFYKGVFDPDGSTEVVTGLLGLILLIINFVITEVGKWFK